MFVEKIEETGRNLIHLKLMNRFVYLCIVMLIHGIAKKRYVIMIPSKERRTSSCGMFKSIKD